MPLTHYSAPKHPDEPGFDYENLEERPKRYDEDSCLLEQPDTDEEIWNDFGFSEEDI